jgi:hypothetical protein
MSQLVEVMKSLRWEFTAHDRALTNRPMASEVVQAMPEFVIEDGLEG